MDAQVGDKAGQVDDLMYMKVIAFPVSLFLYLCAFHNTSNYIHITFSAYNSFFLYQVSLL